MTTLGEKRESAPRLLPIPDMLEILASISRVEPVDHLFQKIVDTTAQAFNIGYVTIGTLDEETGLFRVRAVHGYPPETARILLQHAFSMERMKNDLIDRFKIGRDTYYVQIDDVKLAHEDDLDYVVDPERLNKKRVFQDDWLELDYIDFVMTDRLGNWVGWLEINDPGDGKMPPKDVLDRVRLLADLAAIALENSRLYQDAIDAARDSQGYLDLIVHDIGNMTMPLLAYFDLMVSDDASPEMRRKYAEMGKAVVSNVKGLVNNVKKYSELSSSVPVLNEEFELRAVVEECKQRVMREFPNRKISVEVRSTEGPARVIADGLIFDLFMNLLVNSVKFDSNPVAAINVRISGEGDAWKVELEDRGRGIPDDRKDQIFRRFAKRPEKMGGAGLGLFIVSLLVARYGGMISVRDRVQGDHSQGAVFIVSLPKTG